MTDHPAELRNSPAMSEDGPGHGEAGDGVPAKKRRGPRFDPEVSERKRNQIVAEAAKLFEQVGYHAANMEMVADVSGLRKPTLYHYIKSKEEILFLIHEQLMDILEQKLQARLAREEDCTTILKGVYIDIIGNIQSHPGYVRAFHEHYRELDETTRVQIRTKRNAYLGRIMEIIRHGMDEGVLRRGDVRITALCYLGISNWTYQWYRPGRDAGPEVLAGMLWDLFAGGLVVGKPSASRRPSAPAKPAAAKALAPPAATPVARRRPVKPRS